MHLPRVYWINLDRSPARRERMESRFREHGVTHVRVAAYDGADEAGMRRVLRWRESSPREGACLASHLKAMRLACEQGAELAIIMEDDISFELVGRWPGELDAAILALPSDWSALMLCLGDLPRRLDALFRERGLVSPYGRRSFWSTGAYLIHRRAMEHLLGLYGRDEPYDVLGFPDRHEADTLIFRTLNRATNMAQTHVLRIPLFIFEGEDSEIHSEDLSRQSLAREFILRAYDSLAEGRYRSPLALGERAKALLEALLGRFW